MARRFVLLLAMMGVILISSQLMTAQRQEIKQLDSGERFLLIDVHEDWELGKTVQFPVPSTFLWPNLTSE